MKLDYKAYIKYTYITLETNQNLSQLSNGNCWLNAHTHTLTHTHNNTHTQAHTHTQTNSQ